MDGILAAKVFFTLFINSKKRRKQMASPEIHAKCGASNAHRYLVCTASPTFEAQFPASTSVYAEGGYTGA